MKVSFGRYIPKNSFADKCDPRGKLLFLIAYITAVFLAKNFYGLAVAAAALLLCAAASKTSVAQVFRSVKGVLFLLLFTVIINLFFYKMVYSFFITFSNSKCIYLFSIWWKLIYYRNI